MGLLPPLSLKREKDTPWGVDDLVLGYRYNVILYHKKGRHRDRVMAQHVKHLCRCEDLNSDLQRPPPWKTRQAWELPVSPGNLTRTSKLRVQQETTPQ